MWRWFMVVVLALIAGPAHGQLDEFTQRITSELAAADPQAAEAFVQANAARDRGEFAEAERLYRDVLAKQPTYVHAKRRLASVVLMQGRRSEALTLAREAFAQDSSLENRVALLSLLVGDDGVAIDHQPEVRNHVERLLNASGLDLELLYSAANAALGLQDVILLARVVQRLRRERGDDPRTDYYRWADALQRGKLDEAQRAIELGRTHGLPEDALRQMQEQLDAARPLHERWLPVLGWVFGVWIAIFLALFGAGALLSRAALRAAERAPANTSGEFVGLDRSLRRAYHAVLWLSCGFYYVSLPLTLVAVIVGGGAVVYAFVLLGRIPLQLVAVVAVTVVVTLWAVIKSLIVARRDGEPGEALDLAREPRLRALLVDVAERIGTRPVDRVYVTPGTEVAVFERGGLRRQLQGRTERCLLLGVGALEGFRLGALRAVLAHEYGHFQNRDTAGGGLALAVRRSLFTMAGALARGGAAAPYNPAWLFLNAFYRVFMRISQGASRLQEVMADRWAAFAYGAQEFERGLRHVIERTVRFEAQANHELRLAMEQGRQVHNLYEPRPFPSELESSAAKTVEDVLVAEPSVYDSHPAPRDRFAWVARLETRAQAAPDADEPAWSLFEDRAGLERRMTEFVLQAASAGD